MSKTILFNIAEYVSKYINILFNYFNIAIKYLYIIASFILFNIANISQHLIDTILKIIYIENNSKTVSQNE